MSIIGSEAQSGAYVLRLALKRSCNIAFGRFQGGKALTVAAGAYVYVGSAMGQKGATSLAPRLLRHASRCAGQPPHAIRPELLEQLRCSGLGGARLQPPRNKSLHWHVDYLLDSPLVELLGVIAIRSRRRLEAEIAELLLADPETVPLAAGLGASDAAAQTHLLRVEDADDAVDGDDWWRSLYARLYQRYSGAD